MPKWGAPPRRAGGLAPRLGVDQARMESMMLQSIATPLAAPAMAATPAWDKAASQQRAAALTDDAFGWLAAAAATALVTAGLIALLIAEYGLLWMMLVVPWLECLPTAL